ncbi:MAG: HDOD domain-containing protein [Planctomycetota bacterium]|jgi:HD-like signal output (HDOD) protein
MGSNGFPKLDLKKILGGEHLPAMPQTAIRLLDVSKDPDCGPAEYAMPIEADPGLTVQVLRFVNSSYFGFRNEISNVKQAITLVGVRTIKDFVLWCAVFSMIPNPRCAEFDLKRLWQDSLRRALFARAMGKLLGLPEAEEAFAAALLQDMAVPLLAKEAPEVYEKLLKVRAENYSRVRLSMLEDHVFGWTHAEAAGIMARQWRLPEALADLIQVHLDVQKWSGVPQQEPGKLAVSLSALLPTTTDPRWGERDTFEDYFSKVCPADGPSITGLLAKVDEEYDEFAPILQLSAPEVSLVDSFSVVEPIAQ